MSGTSRGRRQALVVGAILAVAALLGSAEKLFLQLRSQQAAGTGTPSVTVDLETVADALATT